MKFSTSLNRIKFSTSLNRIKSRTASVYNRMIASIEVGLFQLARALSDTASASESGVILNQDYVAGNYFADDYVGTKTIF